MNQAVICDAIQNPIGRGGCVPSNMHADNLGAIPLRALMKAQYGVDSMPETAENVATDYKIEREAQDMALSSQLKAVAAQKAGHLAREIVPVSIPQKKGDPLVVDKDEHLRETSLEALARLKGVVCPRCSPCVSA